ncbi:hypothetical protein GCM10011610_12000 [Nocardia rhizosphaerihabitans]|uniref:Uncharacterized protein n=1 Tax=Nocardia rhizosphaerihabitans TaxID=1691570 RepID=A0ABQ2K8M2_9NOCA|nr:hypothetical protein GCM10011610_12000 [Nocardia rhizosphaerihabitans]
MACYPFRTSASAARYRSRPTDKSPGVAESGDVEHSVGARAVAKTEFERAGADGGHRFEIQRSLAGLYTVQAVTEAALRGRRQLAQSVEGTADPSEFLHVAGVQVA